MDRRDFLKTLGLGGIALTLPKPLDLMANIAGPPIHAGLCRFRDVQGFPFEGIGVVMDHWQVSGLFTQEQFAELKGKWTIHAGVRVTKDLYVPLFRQPLRNSLFGMRSRVDSSSKGMTIMSAESVDVWIVPEGIIRFPLPALTVCMYGPPAGFQGYLVDAKIRPFRSLPLRTVRLERSRAIELGLASPADRFEIL
jgi:hypothetical protein